MRILSEGQAVELGTLPSGFSIMVHAEEILHNTRTHVHITRCGKTCVCINLDAEHPEYFTSCEFDKRKLIELSPMVLGELDEWFNSKPTDCDGINYATNYDWAISMYQKLINGRDLYSYSTEDCNQYVVPDFRMILPDDTRRLERRQYGVERYCDDNYEYTIMVHVEPDSPTKFIHAHIEKNEKTILVIPLCENISPCCKRFNGKDISLSERQWIIKTLDFVFKEKDGKIIIPENLVPYSWYVWNDEDNCDQYLHSDKDIELSSNVIEYFKGTRDSIVD